MDRSGFGFVSIRVSYCFISSPNYSFSAAGSGDSNSTDQPNGFEEQQLREFCVIGSCIVMHCGADVSNERPRDTLI